MLTTPFFSLLRVALGTADSIPRPFSADEWEEVYSMSSSQCILGVMYSGIERLAPHLRPPQPIEDKWAVVTRFIEQENRKYNAYSVRICRTFAADGWRSCILKGQGCAQWYPAPLRRRSGDIDVWVDGNPDDIISYVRERMPNCSDVTRVHIDVSLRNGVLMEVHFTPAYFTSPSYDRRFNEWLSGVRPQQWNNSIGIPRQQVDTQYLADSEDFEIMVPDARFNSVFLPLHMRMHLMCEGVGFKQLLDLYWMAHHGLLTDADAEPLGLLPLMRALSWIFAGLGMPAHLLPSAPDERLGRLLLDDVLTTGSVKIGSPEHQHLFQRSFASKFFHRLHRGWRLRHLCPGEWYFKPLYKAYAYTRYFLHV